MLYSRFTKCILHTNTKALNLVNDNNILKKIKRNSVAQPKYQIQGFYWRQDDVIVLL